MSRLTKGCVIYMNKIAVIGDKDSILGFKSLGLDVFFASDDKSTAENIVKCANEEYSVIFITEQAAAGVKNTIDKYKAVPFPAIILIPSNQGTLGMGLASIRENVEKAVGADIFSGKEGDK